MSLYKYMFFSLKCWYEKNGEKDVPGMFAVGIITLLQWSLYYSPFLILNKFFSIVIVSKVTAVSFVSILLLCNIIFMLSEDKIEKIREEVNNYSPKKKSKLFIFSLLHAMLSIGLFVLALVL